MPTTEADRPTLEDARRDLAAALEGAAHDHAGNDDDLVKAGARGYSIELRFNGATVALAGNDVNELAKDDFQPFLDRERPRLEAGDYDDAIRSALATDGPYKSLARVRALD